MKNVIKKGGLLFMLLCVALIMNHRFGYITLIGVFSIFVLWIALVKREKIDMAGVGVLAYCVSYTLLSALNGFNDSISTIFLHLVAPTVFYYYGSRIATFCDKENDLLFVWFLILFCYSIDVIVVGVNSMLEHGELFASERRLSFYDGEDVSATGIGLPLNISVIGLSMFFLCSNKLLKISYLLLAILSALIITYLLNRTGWVILFFCLFALIALKSLKNTKFFIASVLALVAGLILLSSGDFLNSEFFTLYQQRNEVEGLEGRSDRWIDHISNLIIHPLGWAENGEVYYIHNMWLDIARISGIIPFSLLLGLSVTFFWKAFRYAWRYRTESAYLILGLNICFFLSCFVEPIYGGTHFMLYCLLWGCQSSLERKHFLL